MQTLLFDVAGNDGKKGDQIAKYLDSIKMTADLKILILEDNETDADLVCRQLKKSGLSFASEIVHTRKKYEDALQNFKPDVVLSDYSLPGFDAVTAFRIKQNKLPLIPFIIVSGIIGEENAVELIKNGVTDYTPKNNLVGLAQKIIRALKEAEESKERKSIADKLAIQTAELIVANKQLLFQNEEKEKRAAELAIINKELLAFSYISSHDLQEPLRKIQTFVTLLLENEHQNLSDKGKHTLHRMELAAARMRHLINDLLALSRVSTTELEFEYTDLNSIVEEVKTVLRDIIQEEGATIEATELCHATIIPFQFRQLLRNLLSNSIKFSKPGVPPHVIISSSFINGSDLKDQKLIPGKEYCLINVTDNGIGFEPHFSERIFEVFQKLHNKEIYEGTGMGLAVAKKIVENHKGIITATSELNNGTTFHIYIPVI
ncbi:MAG: hybrid sensor histidine kinase/response regulator [Flavisolibacter sp.]|nr:hybrid sensor histidine kinase/response regulator [Flavisolibacter sp.]